MTEKESIAIKEVAKFLAPSTKYVPSQYEKQARVICAIIQRNLTPLAVDGANWSCLWCGAINLCDLSECRGCSTPRH